MNRLVVVPAILLACACTPVDPAPVAREAAPSEPLPPTTVVDAAKPGVAPPVVAPPVATPPVATPKLFAVVRGETKLQLFVGSDDALFVTVNAEPIRIPDEGPLVREPRLVAGIADPGMMGMLDWRTTALGGRWPDALHMTVEADGERWSARPGVYRFDGNTWESIANVKGRLAWMYTGFGPSTDGTTLALRGWVPADREGEDEGDWDEAAANAITKSIERAAPRELEVLGGKGGKGPRFGEATVLAFASLPTGDVVAIAGSEGMHWTPGATTPQRHPIDGGAPSGPRLQMNAPDDVWMVDPTGARHFDGKAWTEVDVPGEAPVIAVATTSDQRTWIVQGDRFAYSADDNELHVREGAGEWREVELPSLEFPSDAQPRFDYYGTNGLEPADAAQIGAKQPLVAMDVRARGAELWLVARGPDTAPSEGHRWALLHTKDRGSVLEVPDPETLRREMLDARPDERYRGTRNCEVFVPLTTTDVAGPNDDLRELLRKVELPEGATMELVEATHHGKPALGVRVPHDFSTSTTTTKKLTTALEKALGERAADPICKPMLIRRALERWGG
jgi:hypothetical protein